MAADTILHINREKCDAQSKERNLIKLKQRKQGELAQEILEMVFNYYRVIIKSSHIVNTAVIVVYKHQKIGNKDFR